MVLTFLALDYLWRVVTLEPVAGLVGEPAPQAAEDTATRPDDLRRVAPSLHLAEDRCGKPRGESTGAEVFAFLKADDRKGQAAFRVRCDAIDALLFEAMTLREDGSIDLLPDLRSAGTLKNLLDVDHLPPSFAVVTPEPANTASGLSDRLLVADGADTLASRLIEAAEGIGADGACLDLSAHADLTDQAARRLVAAWSARAAVPGHEICLIAGPEADFWRDREVVAGLDHAVVQTFEIASQPAAPAPLARLDTGPGSALAAIPREKLVLAPGSFGLLWRSGVRASSMVSYADTMLLADQHGAQVLFSETAGNSQASFIDADRRHNQIWLADGVATYHAMRALPGQNRFAIWPLGYEDPAVWALLDQGRGAPAGPAPLDGPVSLADQVAALGNGAFVTEATPSRAGRRALVLSENRDRITQVTYSRLPVPTRLDRHCAGQLGDLSITFNGFPSEDDLPGLLDALKARNVTATFFVSTGQLLDRPDAARRVFEQGHGFGTTVVRLFDYDLFVDGLRRFGLNQMQMQLAHETGQRSAFIRERSGRLAAPETVHDLALLREALADGYVAVDVGLDVVRADDPGELADTVRRATIETGMSLLSINLDSHQNVGAGRWVPALLDALQDDGFRFVGLSELAGGDNRLDSLPAERAEALRDTFAFAVIGSLQGKVALLLVLLLAFNLIRSAFYISLAFLRRRKVTFDPGFTPLVSILVPAFNEESVIVRCVDSLLASDYPDLRIVVIDDGSTDHTVEMVQRNWAGDPRVTLLTEENQGKWHAENYAIATIETPIFIGVDADTVIAPDAISWLVQQFKDPRVGAVAGYVEVGNPSNLLTRFQALEYIVGQGLARRAFEVFNGILVVPGAIGAWRTEAVRQAGLYSPSTITEDADLTVAVHRAGYLVRFEEKALAYTEAPERVGALMRQRIRWSLGMLQTSWKHRGALAEGRSVGLISIVDAIWVGFITFLLSPLVYVLGALYLVRAGFFLATNGFSGIDIMQLVLIGSILGLVLVDVVTALAAFLLDRRRDLRLVALVPLTRLGYRQLLMVAALRALARAVTGRLYGWNKLRRTGAVHVHQERVKVAIKEVPAA
ncbi:glycosyltransferase [Maritimibacter sp. HL-12]|uniref:glycosyltransferase n=1 Tax=Maritimibacter sp. HL-12 TaxID=1162418 RepID=UPI001593635D|nr:glycosyltransferase [Maritimibacter sp. HL-12]